MNIRYCEVSELSQLLSLEENEDLINRIKYFYPQYMDDHVHFIAQEENKIVGILALQNSIGGLEPHLHLEYVSVDKDFKNQKIGTSLIKNAIIYCVQKSLNLGIGSYSHEGEAYIKQTITDLAQEYGIKLINKSN